MISGDHNPLTSRILVVSLFFVCIAGAIITQLVNLQVYGNDEYYKKIVEKLTRTKLTLSKRGPILSRDNVILAQDKPSYQLTLSVGDLDFGSYEDENRNLGIIQELEYTMYPKSKKYRPLYRGGLAPTNSEDLMRKIKSLDDRLSRQEILIRLSQEIDIPVEKIVKEVKKAMISCLKKENHLSSKQWLDIHIDEESAMKLLRNEQLYFGFSCSPSTIRDYPQKNLASHLVGYMGKISSKEYKILRIKGAYTRPGHHNALLRLNKVESNTLTKVMVYDVGVEGTESIYNQSLRGKLGRTKHFINMKYEKNLVDDDTSKNGYPVQLSIDTRLQSLAEESLGNYKGAVVLIDMDTGDLLVCASTPSYDPNLISIPRKVNYADYITKNPGILISRPLKHPYPFGSVFKIVTGTAALEEGVATPSTRIPCHKHLRMGRATFSCLGWHNEIEVTEALKRSCNIYFYEVGLKMKIEGIKKWSDKFHLGRPFGLGFPFEKGGIAPDRKWKYQKFRQTWYRGETCHVAIGQGYQNGTPLQAAFVAALISRPQGSKLPRLWTHKKPKDYKLEVSELTRNTIRKGMHRVVNEPRGTAYKQKSDLVIYAGKTGTADYYTKDKSNYQPHAWFAGFAPFENPKVAIAVVVERGGHGGDTAAPIAKKVFEKWAVLLGGYKMPQPTPPSP